MEGNLPFHYNVIFQPYQSFEARSSTTGEIDICPRGLFQTKSMPNDFYLKVFWL